MKIYIAARFSRRHECNALAKVLKNLGHEVVSRWVKPDCDHVIPSGLSEQAADSERARFAMEDIQDLMSADWCISLMENEARNNSRGGRHVEYGFAIARGMRLTVIGCRETVFHHLPQVEHFNDVGEFLEWGQVKGDAAKDGGCDRCGGVGKLELWSKSDQVRHWVECGDCGGVGHVR